MNLKLLLSSSLLGGLLLFFWGAFSHTALPEPITVLKDAAKVDAFMADQTPANGVYMDPRGVFIAVNMLADKSDKSQNMGPLLAQELCSNLLQAVALLWVLLQIRPTSVAGYAKSGAILGLLAWLAVELSYMIWYGISLQVVTMGLIDALGGYALAGAAIGWLIRKYRPA